MIEKSPGCCLVEKLHAILLMEADFNANIKEVIGDWDLDDGADTRARPNERVDFQ